MDEDRLPSCLFRQGTSLCWLCRKSFPDRSGLRHNNASHRVRTVNSIGGLQEPASLRINSNGTPDEGILDGRRQLQHPEHSRVPFGRSYSRKSGETRVSVHRSQSDRWGMEGRPSKVTQARSFFVHGGGAKFLTGSGTAWPQRTPGGENPRRKLLSRRLAVDSSALKPPQP